MSKNPHVAINVINDQRLFRFGRSEYPRDHLFEPAAEPDRQGKEEGVEVWTVEAFPSIRSDHRQQLFQLVP